MLVVSTYELGHQPLSAATATAALTGAGHLVRAADLAIGGLEPADVDWAEGLALSVPMHTAMRLALQVAGAVRQRRPGMAVCFFGLYAGTGAAAPIGAPAPAVVAGEYEDGLVAWAGGGDPGPAVQLSRGASRLPQRSAWPELGRYTHLAVAGELRPVGSVAASRGCSHRCRHCPVPVVYDGRVRTVDRDVVSADVDALVAAGARHVSFADPDFLNAPRHARRVLAAVHDRHPGLTFDLTVKVEHLLRHRDLLPELAGSGCAFVVSALESVDDSVLRVLRKGHTAAQASEAVVALRSLGVELRPSWLPFTPWTTPESLVAMMDFVVAHDLVANVDPVQYSVRLLLPEGSLLLGEATLAPHLGGYDPARLSWAWSHPDPGIDALQGDIAELVEARVGEPTERTFEEVEGLLRAYAGRRPGVEPPPRPAPGEVSAGPEGDRPHLTEAWFCCSEPTGAQLATLVPLSGPGGG